MAQKLFVKCRWNWLKVDETPVQQPSNGNVENGVKNDDNEENDEGSLEPEDAEENTLLKPGKY